MYNEFSTLPLTTDYILNPIQEKKINDRGNTLTLNLRGRNHLGFCYHRPFAITDETSQIHHKTFFISNPRRVFPHSQQKRSF
jgi:hypothetical protein